MRIGPHLIDPPVILAPMAGVTDRPFRQLARRLGAGLAVSEMTTSDPRLYHTEKTRLRMDHEGEAAPIAVQLAGYDAAMVATAAKHNVDQGAQIIDINMGCPAKKVCRVDAGSALMRDEGLVAKICAATVAAAGVPVTLKIRTGFSRAQKNAVAIARIAEGCGIKALTVHGRTREDHYEGFAEYDTIAAVKQAVRIPVIANGDVTTGAKAREVFDATGCDAVMIGRGALGNPWIFGEIAHYLRTGKTPAPPSPAEVGAVLLEHIDALHDFYGEGRGLRVARKHIQWYCQAHSDSDSGSAALWASVNCVECATSQRALVATFFESAATDFGLAAAA